MGKKLVIDSDDLRDILTETYWHGAAEQAYRIFNEMLTDTYMPAQVKLEILNGINKLRSEYESDIKCWPPLGRKDAVNAIILRAPHKVEFNTKPTPKEQPQNKRMIVAYSSFNF